MYIKSMVIEGFKSYGKRVEINGFDREFNAITGLNGSGKSNILDAICFVLGISNLTHVRASGFQDLVYKNGQAGVTKASVTIIFDNTDKEHCPIGYEQHKEITITRQVVIGGKNKYMINGTNCLNKRVQDLFCSVQLNVNNPHFLIMQGRITKVLNMKPPEILSMIEEAAGTSMYEVKRMSTRSTIERKDIKMKELSSVVKEEIAPKLEKMKTERQQVMEYNKIQRELDLLTRLYVAWRYVSAEETAEKAKIQVQQVHDKIAETRQKIVDGATEAEELNKLVQELQSKVDSEKGGILETLEKQLKEKEKLEAKALANQKNIKDTLSSEEKNKKQLAKSLKEDEAALASKESELRKVQGLFDKLKSAQEEDKVALEAAQRKFQAVSSGLLSADDGTNATLEDQLMNAKQAVAQAQTEKKQAEMQLAPCQKELREKEQEMKKTSSNYEGDRQKLENMERELKTLEKELSKLNYKDGHIEDLQEQKRRLSQEIRSLRYQLDNSKSRNPHLNFVYRDPENNFNRASVKGLVCRLVKVKQPHTARALEVAAGGKLYNVIVDTEVTSKKLLKRGQLQRRTTIIPLNKISGHSMNQNTIRTAEQLVGKDNVQPALSLIEYDRELRPAMEWIFGQVFICRDMATARKVTFHERIMKKSVTLDGDSVDPGGTLSGGAAAKGPNVFEEVNKLKEPEEALARKELELAVVDQEIINLARVAERFNSLKERLDLRKHEVELVRQKLQQTSHHRYQEEVDNLKESIAKLGKKVVECTNTVAGNQHKVNDLEAKLKNVKALKETQLQTAKNEMVRLEKKAEESSKQWKQREQDFESLNLEIKELQTSIETSRSQIVALEEKLVELKAQTEQNQADLDKAKTEVLEIKEVIKKQKELINHQNKEIQLKIQKKDKLVKNSSEYELEIKKMEYEITKLRNESDNSHHKVKQLSEKYEWIEREKAYFGKPNGMYDFAENNPEEAGKRIQKLKENLEKMGRTLNMRALANLVTVEDQYQDLLKKKKIVETDREKLVNVIDELDERKKVALREACKKVNQDFGSIFSVLLPGAKACLRPLEGKDVLEGLEVKVGFGDVWKESLGELSGGQRSLVALSLILAMLLFKPAPLYILDEVDAALDLSHTQNIGNMLRSHFRHSQFIVVSLKDGMFNNANVLFRTKFVDGMSTVQRSVQHVVPRPLSSLDNKRNH